MDEIDLYMFYEHTPLLAHTMVFLKSEVEMLESNKEHIARFEKES
jgi:hypothetical protein